MKMKSDRGFAFLLFIQYSQVDDDLHLTYALFIQLIAIYNGTINIMKVYFN